VTRYITKLKAAPKREQHCTGELEGHFTEGAVMIAFAMHLLEQGAKEVHIHRDGEHGKRYDIAGCLTAYGFAFEGPARGRTTYVGTYRRGGQAIVVSCKPGCGDVVAEVAGSVVVAECKGGILNTRHSGQLSKLRRGFCEAVGLLLTRSEKGERQVAVVPATRTTESLAIKLASRARMSGIEIALVDEHGGVKFLDTRGIPHSDVS
jgi:hypothetical protein